MNPQGCSVAGFKEPSKEEMAHDFLWRIHRASLPKGNVTIFNRSQYEDVLAVRVHDLVPRVIWSNRYDQINGFEEGACRGWCRDPEVLSAHLRRGTTEPLQEVPR